jgi:hypothetical protein
MLQDFGPRRPGNPQRATPRAPGHLLWLSLIQMAAITPYSLGSLIIPSHPPQHPPTQPTLTTRPHVLRPRPAVIPLALAPPFLQGHRCPEGVQLLILWTHLRTPLLLCTPFWPPLCAQVPDGVRRVIRDGRHCFRDGPRASSPTDHPQLFSVRTSYAPAPGYHRTPRTDGWNASFLCPVRLCGIGSLPERSREVILQTGIERANFLLESTMGTNGERFLAQEQEFAREFGVPIDQICPFAVKYKLQGKLDYTCRITKGCAHPDRGGIARFPCSIDHSRPLSRGMCMLSAPNHPLYESTC